MSDRIPFTDPAAHAVCSQPMESSDAANAALRAFYTELRDLRLKHKIEDVLCVVSGRVLPEGGTWISSIVIGDTLHGEGLAAYAYGTEKRNREDAISRALGGKANP